MAEIIPEQKEVRTGYLIEDFHLFYLKDQQKRSFSFHYHDFHKIILILSGNVRFTIEGKCYQPLPGDLLFIPAGSIHQPVISNESPYERFILYLSSDCHCQIHKLTACMDTSRNSHEYLLRTSIKNIEQLKELLSQLYSAILSDKKNPEQFGAALLNQSIFQQIMIYLNRYAQDFFQMSGQISPTCDPLIVSIMNYIHSHLCDDLSLPVLSSLYHLSSSRLMHKFKLETGFTIHQYILQKRLLLVQKLVHEESVPITKAALLGGFHDYTSYYRALQRSNNQNLETLPE